MGCEIGSIRPTRVFERGPGHDFVVGLVAAGRGADIYLVDRVKAQWSFPDTLAAIRQTCRQYPSARTILVEDTANGPAVIDTLRHEIPGIIAVRPPGDKVQRATACAPRVEAGNVYLPRPTGPTGRRLPARAWVDDFIEQLCHRSPNNPPLWSLKTPHLDS